MHAASAIPQVLRIASTLGKTQGTLNSPIRSLLPAHFKGSFSLPSGWPPEKGLLHRYVRSFLEGEVLNSRYSFDGLHLNGVGFMVWKRSSIPMFLDSPSRTNRKSQTAVSLIFVQRNAGRYIGLSSAPSFTPGAPAFLPTNPAAWIFCSKAR